METTPFEEAILRAQDLAAGLALSQKILELAEESLDEFDCQTEVERSELDAECSTMALSLIAATQAVCGISA